MSDFWKDSLMHSSEVIKMEQAKREIERDHKKIKLAEEQKKKIELLVSVSTKQSEAIEALTNLINTQGRQSARFSRLSLIFSILAVLLASAAVFFSVIDHQGDVIWQEQQIDVLSEIKEQITPPPTTLKLNNEEKIIQQAKTYASE